MPRLQTQTDHPAGQLLHGSIGAQKDSAIARDGTAARSDGLFDPEARPQIAAACPERVRPGAGRTERTGEQRSGERPSGRHILSSRHREAQRASMPAHRFFLMSEDAQRRTGISTAQQHVTGHLILREEAPGFRLIDAAFENASRAGATPPLQTGVRQIQPGIDGRIQQIAIVGRHGSHFLPGRCYESHGVRCQLPCSLNAPPGSVSCRVEFLPCGPNYGL